MPMVVLDWQDMTSYLCSIVTLVLDGTVVELQAVNWLIFFVIEYCSAIARQLEGHF